MPDANCKLRIANCKLQIERRAFNPSQFAFCILHFAFFLCSLLPSGCSSLKNPLPSAPDIHAKRQEQHEAAVRQFEQRRNDAQYQAAMACWRTGDTQGCQRGLEELVRRSPDHLDSRLALADLCLCLDDLQQAKLHAQHALSLAPRDARVYHALGQALEALKEIDAACAQYQRAVELDSQNEIYRLSLENLLDPAGSVTAADFAVASDGGASPVEIGTSAATRIINAEPDTPGFAVAQAAQALRSNQPELAIRIAREGIRRYGDHAGLYRTLGTAQYRQGDYRAAQVALRQAVSLDKSHPLSYFLLSATLKKLGEEDEARRCLAQAEGLDPALAAWR